MRIGQLDKTIRKTIIKGARFWIQTTTEGQDGKNTVYIKPYECIGTYAHICTFRQTQPPHLTVSYTWFDEHQKMMKGEITKRKPERRRRVS